MTEQSSEQTGTAVQTQDSDQPETSAAENPTADDQPQSQTGRSEGNERQQWRNRAEHAEGKIDFLIPDRNSRSFSFC